MDRPRFTPRMWHSEDGKYTFYMSENGATDIIPGPKFGLWKWISDNYSESKDPVKD